MKIETKKIKQIHLSRSIQFGIVEAPTEKKYFGNKKNSIYTALFVLVVVLFLFFFTEYKEVSIRVGIFAFLFSGYKIYQAVFNPVLKFDAVGVHFQNTKMKWSRIKKINSSWGKTGLIIEIQTKDGKFITEKLSELEFQQVLDISSMSRAFKKRYRIPYQFKK